MKLVYYIITIIKSLELFVDKGERNKTVREWRKSDYLVIVITEFHKEGFKGPATCVYKQGRAVKNWVNVLKHNCSAIQGMERDRAFQVSTWIYPWYCIPFAKYSKIIIMYEHNPESISALHYMYYYLSYKNETV